MTTDCQFWLTADGENQKIQLPVNPEKITIDYGSNCESVTIAELGEILILQSRPAVGYAWSGFFPAAEFPGIKVKTIADPLALAERIVTWKNSRMPVHFVVTSNHIDMYCAIAGFQYYEQGGDVGTCYYDISLKEYRELAVRQVQVDIPNQKASITQTDPRVDNTAAPQTYTVAGGDCLWNIAKKFYGDGALWRKIYDANRDVVGGNPDLIFPGQVLVIPA